MWKVFEYLCSFELIFINAIDPALKCVAKYLSPQTPGNVWRESLLEPAQKPVNGFAVSGTVKQTVLNLFICCYSNGINK